MNPLRTANFAAIALIACLAFPAVADDDDFVPTIAVAGSGEARAKPDAAEVRLAAVGQGETAKGAMAQVARATERLLSAIKKQGVASVSGAKKGRRRSSAPGPASANG
jgi:uncharacterized protein YggE